MTNRDAPQDFDPKHRIIGAIVVVALAVIFVPMILSQREAPSERPSTPPTDQAAQGAAAETKVAITKVPPPPAMSEPIKPVAPEPAKALSAPSAPEPAKAAPKAAAAAKPAPQSAAKPAAASSGWVVQVGTFSDTANATRLEQKLRAEGEPVRAEPLQMASGKAVRLRVGPFRDRATAVKAQERIQKDVGVKGVVLAFP
jgi:DedD protein